MALLGSEQGIRRVVLPQPSPRAAVEALGKAADGCIRGDSAFADLQEQIKGYFKGEVKGFTARLDLSEITPFQRQVYEVNNTIPYGETRSYGWVAQHLGKPEAARAVGQALARNPLPLLIPCHRVVAGDGGLGGYGGGLGLKRWLLEMEAAHR